MHAIPNKIHFTMFFTDFITITYENEQGTKCTLL